MTIEEGDKTGARGQTELARLMMRAVGVQTL
jgi:hypothetical protein